MAELWPHQIRAYDQTVEKFRRGADSVCVVMPCGAGKSRFGAYLAARHIEKYPTGRVLWVCHRTELLSQGYEELETWGLSVGAIGATTNKEFNPHRPVQIASVQTLLARDAAPEATLVIADEFHHFSSDKWFSFASQYRHRKVPMIGLTATAVRGDGRGFRGLMDDIITPVTMKELIAAGFLVPFELVHPGRTLSTGQIAASPVASYQKHAPGRRAICFANSIVAMHKYVEEFIAAGITSAAIWGEMDSGLRRSTLARYKAGEISVLVNVGVLTEGFDDRATDCVILARSIGTLALYLQCVGRALRCSPETGKTDAVIIDLHGTCNKDGFGSPDDDREWTLDGDGVGRNKETTPERFCPVCGVLLEGSNTTICELCGIAKPELCPPDVLNLSLVRYQHKRKESPEVRRAYFDKLKAIAKERGWSKWQPHFKYQAIYSEKPPRSWW